MATLLDRVMFTRGSKGQRRLTGGNGAWARQ